MCVLSSTFALTISYYVSKYKIMMSALGTIYILRKGVLELFKTTQPPNVRTFLLFKVRGRSQITLTKLAIFEPPPPQPYFLK
jgi:hypothetical protein